MQFNRIFRDAGVEGAGASKLPSLADLDDPNFKPATPPQEEEPKPDPVEGLDAEGNLLEGYTRQQDGTIAKDAKDPQEEEEDEGGEEEESSVTPEEFYTAVSAQTGIEVNVDFGEVDPLSPEGVALRDLALVQQTRHSFEEALKTEYPRAYAFFLHNKEGGSDEEFFKAPAPAVIAREAFEADMDVQESWIKKDLLKKGLSQTIVDLQVKEYITQGTLTQQALKVYDQVVREDKLRLQEIQTKEAERQKAFESSVQNLSQEISTTVKNGMKSLVPETKQAEFVNFVMNHIQHDGESNFFAILPVSKEQLATTMDSLYLQYMKGDLSKVVVKEAKKQTVQRLKLGASRDNADKKKNVGDPDTSKKFIPLSEI
ncbi:MAG: hypothetical protein EKK63_02355 [Acinetobacter sp.]|uniref:hypothetical protein n=1 Tax=Acinetobacter sp. TaxID=472 RepID=UPI000F9A7002|nr:hypothetical protein [Acinetobacter sp.]RUP42159.1 MAG: hypothetical protein EKK63_02355 [Acinetobacter sp.]